MKKVPISILCGIVAILATVVSYFLLIDNIFSQIICFVTLFGVVIAETVVTALAYRSNGEPRKVAATITAGFMIPISLLLSVVYIVNFPNGYASYLGYYFLIFAIILVICAVIWRFADNRATENDTLQNAKANMLGLRKLVQCVMLKQNAKNFKKELDEIEEKLHFSNDSVITEADEVIRRMLIELENNIDNNDFDAAGHIKALLNEIDRRTIWSKNSI